MSTEIDFSHFEQVDIRVGTVVSAALNPKSHKPAFVLEVDFGPFGVKTTSAQITQNYEPSTLVGQQIVAVVNFPSKRVAGVKSEVLVLAVVSEEKGVVLLRPDHPVANGEKID